MGEYRRFAGCSYRNVLSIIPGLMAAALLLLSSCASEDATDVVVVFPVISSVSASSVSVGDTITITGTDFALPVTNNRVIFNNTLAMPKAFAGSSTSLSVVVPVFANSGPMRISANGVASNSKIIAVQRAIGDVWVVGGDENYSFKAAAPTGTEQFLIIPHSVAAAVANHSYTITPDTTSVFPAPPADVDSGTRTAVTRFKSKKARELDEYLKGPGRDKKVDFSKPSVPGAPPAQANFFVYRGGSTLQPGSYTTVSASLQYTGTRALVYADDNQPTGSFNQAEFAAFGMQFDSQIFPVDSMFFGPPTDINGDGHVAILFSPEVNKLTPAGTAQTEGFISGFFLGNDLIPGIVPDGTSNSREIFYAMVPDPNNEFGNAFSKATVQSIMPGTLAHEFEHMISFGFRFLNIGTAFGQKTWLEEGMAHIAEDLNNFDSQNILRGNLYIANPGSVSLKGADTLEQRGGIFMFLRYLGDQYGEGIYKTIVRSSCIGTECISNATGKNFAAVVADFLATLYLSDRGITSDPKYQFASFNVQADFDSVLAVTSHQAGDGAFSDAVVSATGDFHLINSPVPPAINFNVQASAIAKMRAIVVRTQ